MCEMGALLQSLHPPAKHKIQKGDGIRFCREGQIVLKSKTSRGWAFGTRLFWAKSAFEGIM